jgi:hypothetical protein
MKTELLCLIMIALSVSAYCQKKSPDIEGAWKLIQTQSITALSPVIEFPGKSVIDETKIWSGNNFMFVARVKTDTVVDDMYGVGTYKLQGNRYDEYLRIISYKPWEGTTIKMTIEIKNDTLIQIYPVDDKGIMDKNWASIEKYVRIKK